jgi:hypothetical protein
MLELRALKKMPKLMRTLEELRCEGVNFNALELVFFKDALAHLRIHIFCEMEQILGQYPSWYWHLIYCIYSHVLFGFSSKAEARWPIARQIVPTRAEALPLIPAPSAKKGKWGAKAPRKTGAAGAPHSTSVRGHRWKSVKAIVDQVLVDVGARTSDELPIGVNLNRYQYL